MPHLNFLDALEEEDPQQEPHHPEPKDQVSLNELTANSVAQNPASPAGGGSASRAGSKPSSRLGKQPSSNQISPARLASPAAGLDRPSLGSPQTGTQSSPNRLSRQISLTNVDLPEEQPSEQEDSGVISGSNAATSMMSDIQRSNSHTPQSRRRTIVIDEEPQTLDSTQRRSMSSSLMPGDNGHRLASPETRASSVKMFTDPLGSHHGLAEGEAMRLSPMRASRSRSLMGSGLVQTSILEDMSAATAAAPEPARSFIQLVEAKDAPIMNARTRAGPNMEVLEQARKRSHNPNVDVMAMVGAYNPFPMIWPGPKEMSAKRRAMGRPLRDEWGRSGNGRFPRMQQGDLGPGTYSPTPKDHLVDAGVVFKSKASRFAKISVGTSNLPNVGPGVYGVDPVKSESQFTPWVKSVTKQLGRAVAPPGPLRWGPELKILEQFGDADIHAWRNKPADNKSNSTPSRSSARPRALPANPYSKEFIVPNL